MLGQRLLHFLRRNHLAAALDEIAGAAGQVDIAVRILPGQVSGVEPAGAQGIAGGIGLLPVAGHHPRPARDNFAHFPLYDGFAVLGNYHHLHIIKRLANGRQAPQLGFHFLRRSGQQVVVRRKHSNGGRRFRLPKGVDETGAGKLGDGFPYHRQRHRGRAVGDDIQRGQVVLGKPGMLHNPLQHRRHQHCPVGPVFGSQSQPLLRVKLGHYYQRAPAEHRRQGRLQPGHMVQRHGEQVSLRNLRVRRRHAGKQKGGETVVGQLRPFWHAGSAGSEHNHRGRVPIVLRKVNLGRTGPGQQVIVAVPPLAADAVQHNDAPAGHPSLPGRQRQVALPQKHQGRRDDAGHRRQFVRLGAKVDRNIDGIQLRGGKIDFQQMMAVGVHRRHPVAAADSQLPHSIGQAVHPLLQRRKADPLPFKDDGRAFRHDGRGYQQNFASVHSFRLRFRRQHIERRQSLLQAEGGVQGQFGSVAPRGAQGGGQAAWYLRQPTRRLPAALTQGLRRGNPADQPAPQRLAGREPPAGKQQLQRHRRPGAGRQRLRASGGRNHSQMQFRHRKNGIRRRNADIGQQHYLNARADAVAMDGRHNGLVQVNQLSPNVPLPARPTGNDLRGRGSELSKVGAGAESPSLPADKQRPNFRILGCGGQRHSEVVPHRHGISVALRRPVQRYMAHAALLFVADGGERRSHNRQRARQSSAMARRIISSRSTAELPAPISASRFASLTEKVSRP